MMIRFNVAAAAIAAACLSSAVTPAYAQERQPVKANVLIADLDLSSSAGRAIADQRIARIADTACDNGSRDLAMIADGLRCRREMIASAQQQVAQLAQKRNVMVATVTDRRGH